MKAQHTTEIKCQAALGHVLKVTLNPTVMIPENGTANYGC